ncbi:histidinol-phosphate transaminase [Natronospora cellulosivora (SeqCode)]
MSFKSNVEKLSRKELAKLKPYIPGKPIEEVKLEYGLENVVKLASNENPLGVSEKVKAALIQESENIHRYPDGACRILKKDLALKLEINEDMLLFGNGSDGLLKVLAETFITEEDEIIISDPTFVEYIFVSNLMGAKLKKVNMDPYYQDLNKIADAVNEKTKMIFLTSPHNPAGTIIKDEELRSFMDSIPNDIIVILDEAYFEYVQSKDYPDAIDYIKEGYPIISFRTFSKAYALAGLRIGYAIANPEIIGLLAKTRDPFNVNRLAQKAAQIALRDEDFLKKTIEVNESGKKYLYKEFEKRGINYVPTEANFILVDMKCDSMDLFSKLLKIGVVIRPGKPLGYPEHIRVSIGLPEENKIFVNSIDKIHSR